MNASIISMDKEEAARKLEACLEETHKDGEEFNRSCAQAYEALAAGRKLLHLSKSFQLAGVDENHRPRLAIAAADREQVFCRWRSSSPFALFSSSANFVTSPRSRRLVRTVNMAVPHKRRHPKLDFALDVFGYALVPKVPADVRPVTGQLRDWYVLWEVEQWFDRPQGLTAPTDPLLLKHVAGELYAVLAEWDLTDVERAILEELQVR